MASPVSSAPSLPLLRAAMTPPVRGACAGALGEHARALAGRLAPAFVPGNRVELLQDGPPTYEAMFGAISQSRHHVNLESYILEREGPGEEFARRLGERARAGVRVNILFDSFGSLRTPAAFFEGLRAQGVRVAEYNPVARLGQLLGRALHLRDHRKLMVVDGRAGFIGGVNISPVYSSGSSPIVRRHPHAATGDKPGWRDTHLRVEGPVVAQMQRLFIRHWVRQGAERLDGAGWFPPLEAAGTQVAALAACDAGRRRNPFYTALLAAIDAAQERVLLTTAYLVPTRRLLRALIHAARRGVDVHLLLPGISDFWAPLAAGRSHYGRLLRAGVHLHERHDTLLHAKTCVIDGLWTTVGSSNLDWRSFLHNAEANLVVLDAGLAQEMERTYADDLARAVEIDRAGWARRGLRQRLAETLARRFEFFL